MTESLVIATGVTVAGLLWADDRPARFVLKPLASAGFLAVALSVGLLESTYGAWIFAGLVMGAVGDVALLGAGDRPFLFGLLAFLLGHAAYGIAFAGQPLERLPIGVAVALVLAAGSWAWLRRHVVGALRNPVAVYVVVISAMVAIALGASQARPLGAIGALLFAASDLAVARDRFVTPGPWNGRIGLPLYYAGQILIALSGP